MSRKRPLLLQGGPTETKDEPSQIRVPEILTQTDTIQCSILKMVGLVIKTTEGYRQAAKTSPHRLLLSVFMDNNIDYQKPLSALVEDCKSYPHEPVFKVFTEEWEIYKRALYAANVDRIKDNINLDPNWFSKEVKSVTFLNAFACPLWAAVRQAKISDFPVLAGDRMDLCIAYKQTGEELLSRCKRELLAEGVKDPLLLVQTHLQHRIQKARVCVLQSALKHWLDQSWKPVHTACKVALDARSCLTPMKETNCVRQIDAMKGVWTVIQSKYNQYRLVLVSRPEAHELNMITQNWQAEAEGRIAKSEAEMKILYEQLASSLHEYVGWFHMDMWYSQLLKAVETCEQAIADLDSEFIRRCEAIWPDQTEQSKRIKMYKPTASLGPEQKGKSMLDNLISVCHGPLADTEEWKSILRTCRRLIETEQATTQKQLLKHRDPVDQRTKLYEYAGIVDIARYCKGLGAVMEDGNMPQAPTDMTVLCETVAKVDAFHKDVVSRAAAALDVHRTCLDRACDSLSETADRLQAQYNNMLFQLDKLDERQKDQLPPVPAWMESMVLDKKECEKLVNSATKASENSGHKRPPVPQLANLCSLLKQCTNWFEADVLSALRE
jgi:hypothetical protein